MPLEADTIVAISTPPGRGGIGIVRLSGPRAVEIATPLLQLRHPLGPGQARFGQLLDRAQPDPNASDPASNLEPRASHLVLDEVVVTFFAAPHSYTGEDVVEIAAHGSPVLLDHIVRQSCNGGARLAEPGEFTQRAFLSGRIDLTQAEAVADLIASSTLEQARLAARQLGGSLARSVAPIKTALVGLIAALEAGIDFAEDDIDVLPAAAITARIAELHAPLAELERTFATGRVLRDGFRLAIVGRPNAGKSSMFNRLVERDRAIVTASPGTTRDLVTETVAIEGIPVHLIDTAGLRDSGDEAERLGIAKSRQAMADADVVLLVLDAPSLAAANALPAEDAAILADHTPGTLLLALNKIDLLPDSAQISTLFTNMQPSRLQASPASRFASNLEPRTSNPVETSALTGAGIAVLRAAIVASVAGPGAAPREAALVTNLRQHQAVAETLRALGSARAAVAGGIPHEMLLLDLYAALRALDTLTGATTTDDVLHLIFSTFCIGK
jgi:tRNA modification GTPase